MFPLLWFTPTVVNPGLKPWFKIVSLPLLILTLGLFSVIITWFILYLTRWIVSFFDFVDMSLGGFWKTLFAAILIAIVAAIVEALLPGKRRGRR
nr:MAG: hypothetical protein DIU73_05555 [Actinomycetota bacterium]